MRNLKRVLSLTLASAMLFGMMVMGASAADKTYADLTDKDKIENTEAVALMVDLGIIVGKPDGSFSPAEVINRATMAKLITYIMMGDVDPSSFAGTSVGLNDVSGHWAEGYIKYCFANGIISGDGTNFYPDKDVTTVEAGKMLLVALGYDAETQGYQNNASWSVNIMRDAQKAGLTNGVTSKASDGLTRDNAAQMIYNALFASTVSLEYTYDQGTKYVSKVNSNPTTLGLEVYGLVKNTGEVTATGTTTTLKTNTSVPAGAAATTFDVSAPGAVGKTVTIYTKNAYTVSNGTLTIGAVKAVYSSEIAASASNVLATSSKGTSYTNLTTKGNSKYIGYAADTTPVLYYNGVAADTAGAKLIDNTTAATTANIQARISNPGVVVTFLDNDSNSKYDTIDVTEYMFSKVTAVKAGTNGNEDTVTITGINNTSGTLSYGAASAVDKSQTLGAFASLEKSDYVLVAIIDGVLNIKLPEAFTGTMTKYTTSSGNTATMTIDGTVHNVAVSIAKTLTAASTFNTAKEETTFYTDSNGYIVAVEAVTSTKNYAAIDAIAFVSGSGVNGSGYAEAKLILADGTTEVVKVSKIDGYTTALAIAGKPAGTIETTTAGDKYIYVDTASANNNGLTSSASVVALGGQVFTYTVSSEKYVLTAVSVADAASGNVSKGVATVASKVANNDTVFVVKSGTASSPSYKTYTGYKNVPSVTGANLAYAINTSGALSFVYVDAVGKTVGDATYDVAYILSTSYTTDASGDTTLYEYKAVLNGEEVTLVADASTYFSAVGLYKVTLDSDTVVTSAAAGTTADYTAVATATADASGGVLTDGTNYYSYDGTEEVYIINGTDVTVGTAEDILTGYEFQVKVINASGTAAERVAISVVYAVVK